MNGFRFFQVTVLRKKKVVKIVLLIFFSKLIRLISFLDVYCYWGCTNSRKTKDVGYIKGVPISMYRNLLERKVNLC